MILGVDTSCYTTSMIVIDDYGSIVYENNHMLKVKPGERGLRQSEGFFQHVNKLSEVFSDLVLNVNPLNLTAIAVSSRPRPVEGSYMPVFHAGVLFATNLSNALGLPLYTFSHQEGHLMAALHSLRIDPIPERFIGLHLSGGTTELLSVKWFDKAFEIELIGGTLDLNFGQLIDRIGIKLGLAFPCGKEMDQMAQTVTHNDCFKIKKMEFGRFNLSGLENQYNKLITEKSAEYCCRHIFNTISNLLYQLISDIPSELSIVFSGGVSSNSIVKEWLKYNCPHKTLYFSPPEYSRDNALGVAEMGRLQQLG
ncbi:MAG: hypothetical protein BGO41_01945 [Clostridiales bacterium 38-18]|nr:MAG: hypothetical protein BGO41_01945 [Clostridiales bacterium 38-18]